MPSLRFLPAAALAAAVVACSGDPSDPAAAADVPYAVGIISGDGQIGTVSDTLRTVLTARVTNATTGGPVAGLRVNWRTTAGGNPTTVQTITDRLGFTTTKWVLGDGTGAQSMVATIVASTFGTDSTSTTFTATAYGVGALHFVGVFDGDTLSPVTTTYDVTQHFHFVIADEHGDSIGSAPVVNLPSIVWAAAAGQPSGAPPSCPPVLDVTTIACPPSSGLTFSGRYTITVQQGSFDGIANPDYRGTFHLRVGPNAAANAVTFMSDRAGAGLQVWIMNADGSSPTQLTSTGTAALHPRWSPDGSKIVFFSTRSGVTNVYVMNADGSSQTRLTTNAYTDAHPSWSPDGTKIVYQCGTAASQYDICVMHADGSNIVNITNSPANDQNPDWSPDGQWIVWECNQGGTLQLCRMHPDGTGVAQLTTTGVNRQATWSRDGGSMVFTSERDGNAEVYAMRADGTQQTRLTNDPGADDFARVMPDGNTIVFSSNRSGTFQLYVMNADGSGVQPIGASAGNDQAPDWR